MERPKERGSKSRIKNAQCHDNVYFQKHITIAIHHVSDLLWDDSTPSSANWFKTYYVIFPSEIYAYGGV